MKVYRGSAVAARAYVEADRSRADDYYLAEGTGVAELLVASPRVSPLVRAGAVLGGDAYEGWVAGYDEAGVAKGRLRTDDKGVRFVEVVVNGPKTYSLAAALHPEVAAAYDVAQESAARQIVGWVGEHATTRVGPRGRQVQVGVEQVEAAVVRHYTSRAGDPHRHLHVQINSRVFAVGKWRSIHTVGIRDSLDAINGIGRAAIQCDPGFRAALAAHGYTLDTISGEIRELEPFVGQFSARAAQIGRNVDRYEAQWRTTHRGQEPGPRLRRTWDTRAWAEARPDKVVPTDGAQLARRWVEELHGLGFVPPAGPAVLDARQVGMLDRDKAVEIALQRLAARRSAWNGADVRGEVEQIIAMAGVVADPAVRTEAVEDLTSRALAACVPLLTRDDVPEHVRALTSPRVLEVEADLVTRLTTRAASGLLARDRRWLVSEFVRGLDQTQRQVVAALIGHGDLIVIEGAAGAGKTATLAAARANLAQFKHRMVIATPTLKAAQVAGVQAGTKAHSAAWLIYQYGYRWDEHGRWGRVPNSSTGIPADAQADLNPGDVLVIDEAGMLDQDTARALLTVADETGCRVALVGDRHQLPAVGRGGVLDLATRWALPQACLSLNTVHRFADAEYANLTAWMRTGERAGAVFDQLLDRGEIRIHPTETERTHALTTQQGRAAGGSLLIADTREQVTLLNDAIRDARVAAGHVDDGHTITTRAGGRIGVGDRVATRRNNKDLDVANRDIWAVTSVSDDATVTLQGRKGERVLPADYVREHLQLAYASTVYGAQGETTDTAHLIVDENTGAAAAYVAMTRGRHHNTAHLVAETIEEARDQWVAVFSRDYADLGPGHAATIAAEDIDRYGPDAPTPRIPPSDEARERAMRRVLGIDPDPDHIRSSPPVRLAAATAGSWHRTLTARPFSSGQGQPRSGPVVSDTARLLVPLPTAGPSRTSNWKAPP